MSKNLKEKQYVAFLDVLGFKEMLRKKDTDLRFDKYFEVITKTLKKVKSSKENVRGQLVSDSVILASELSIEGLRELLTAVQTIQCDCARENIWIRGAVTLGDIHFDTELNIVVGNGLSDAYILESQEKYPRVIIDPRIIASYDSNPSHQTKEYFILQYNYDSIYPGAVDRPNRLIYQYPTDFTIINNDAIFISFAERIALKNIDDLEYIYTNIKNELYSGTQNYAKYLWLKNYLTQTLFSHSNFYGNSEPKDREKAHYYANKFDTL
ncbi:MAG: hypothetical protein IM638_13595 [Bacteroidetes bacterium]|nr:hypothetical protein [Bacteroidota bacterium]